MTRRMRPVSGDVWAPCLSLGQVRTLWRWLLPLCQADLAPVWGTGVIHHHQEITLLKQSWSIIKLGHLKCDTDLSETDESRVTCIAQSAGIVNVEICLSLAATGGWWRAVTLKTGRERDSWWTLNNSSGGGPGLRGLHSSRFPRTEISPVPDNCHGWEPDHQSTDWVWSGSGKHLETSSLATVFVVSAWQLTTT